MIMLLDSKLEHFTFLSFLWTCAKYYFRARKVAQGLTYFAVSTHGVPQVSVMIAHGRNAWRLSQFAVTYFAEGGQA